MLKIEMHFLPAVYVACEECNGRRYNRETLEIHYKGLNIADVLEMTVDEACAFFRAVPQVYDVCLTLSEVGLGYLQLGQSATTLSGGEAQRVKLASELCKRSTGRTLYLLDEPTTGLHFHEIFERGSVDPAIASLPDAEYKLACLSGFLEKGFTFFDDNDHVIDAFSRLSNVQMIDSKIENSKLQQVC